MKNECFLFSPLKDELWTLPSPDPSDSIPPLHDPLTINNNLYEIWREPVLKVYYLPVILPTLASEAFGHPTGTDECGVWNYEIDPAIDHFATLVQPTKRFPVLKIESSDTAVSAQNVGYDYTKDYLINLTAELVNFPSVDIFEYEITKSEDQPEVLIKMIDRCLAMYFKKPYLEDDGITNTSTGEKIKVGGESRVGELEYILGANAKWFKIEDTKPYLY